MFQPAPQSTTTYAAPPAAAAPSLLDAALAATPAAGAARGPVVGDALDRFLAEKDVGRAVGLWFGGAVPAGPGDLRGRLVRRLNADIARVDELVGEQTNAVLHHPAFQKLEASWRGLLYLVGSVPDGANVKIRVLNIPWREVVKDQERALEFDQSQLFRKVYNEEFGTPGGEPYGLLIGDYDVCHRPFPDHPTDDLSTLRGVAAVAAAAFAPFVCGADPRLLELDSFTALEQPFDLARTFDQVEYLKWRAFRDADDARFVGLALPRMVLRRPYGDEPGRTHSSRFVEDVSAADRSGYLWGNAAYGFAAVAVRAFAETAWLAEIRGVRTGEERAGLVTGLPAIGYDSGAGEDPRSVTEAYITDAREKELSDLGFLPLCHTPGAAEAAFYTTPSAQRVKTYADAAAGANARLSAMLQYILCVSRFAHFIKVIIRDRVGAYTTADVIQDDLQKWLARYVMSNDNASDEMKSKYPLREGKVQVREVDGKPGSYQCTIFLRPHFQLDQLSAGVRLTTQLISRAES